MLRMSRIVRTVVAVCACAYLCAPVRAVASEVSVFAAASLAEALQTVAQKFEAESGYRLRLTFAGSSALARQIEYGAPADVFISANAAWVSHLNERGLLETSLEKTLYGGALVMIAPADRSVVKQEANDLNYGDVVADGRLAMALVEAVPAGIYGRQALESLGVWQSLQSQVAQVDSVRSALALVALGEASAGIVYATDAKADKRVQIVTEFPAGLHDPIVYPAAVIAGQTRPEVLEFMSFWEGEATRSAFEAHGFRVLEAEE